MFLYPYKILVCLKQGTAWFSSKNENLIATGLSTGNNYVFQNPENIKKQQRIHRNMLHHTRYSQMSPEKNSYFYHNYKIKELNQKSSASCNIHTTQYRHHKSSMKKETKIYLQFLILH